MWPAGHDGLSTPYIQKIIIYYNNMFHRDRLTRSDSARSIRKIFKMYNSASILKLLTFKKFNK